MTVPCATYELPAVRGLVGCRPGLDRSRRESLSYPDFKLVCVDVDYRESVAVAAAVLFHAWGDESPAREVVVPIREVQPYVPGQFYRRELPCLLRVLGALATRPEVVVVDGYVWLGPENEPGLGAVLYEALSREAAVIGCAKTPFRGSTNGVEVIRGGSRSPLFVTAAGMDPTEAADHIRSMHGAWRIPTLLSRVDRLARSWDPAGSVPFNR
jgi:deoxyribonuclease V